MQVAYASECTTFTTWFFLRWTLLSLPIRHIIFSSLEFVGKADNMKSRINRTAKSPATLIIEIEKERDRGKSLRSTTDSPAADHYHYYTTHQSNRVSLGRRRMPSQILFFFNFVRAAANDSHYIYRCRCGYTSMFCELRIANVRRSERTKGKEIWDVKDVNNVKKKKKTSPGGSRR